MADEQTPAPAPVTDPKPSKGYAKRPLWQWVVIYLVLAVIIYGAIYYFFIRDDSGQDSGGSIYRQSVEIR